MLVSSQCNSLKSDPMCKLLERGQNNLEVLVKGNCTGLSHRREDREGAQCVVIATHNPS